MLAEDWARFLSKAELDVPCVIWTGAKSAAGYGQMSVGNKVRYAHRLAWEHFHGTKVPKGMYVRHLCENPACVRFVHLAIGTPSQNRWDMSDEKRRALAITREAKKSPEERKIHAAKMRAARTPEGIELATKKLLASKTPERNHAAALKREAASSPQQRRDRMLKAWRTRRST